MVAEIRHPQLVVCHVQSHAQRILHHAPRSLDDANRSYIAVGVCPVHSNAVARIIRNEQFPSIRVDGNRRRPVHQRLRSLDDAQRRHITPVVLVINGYRRKIPASTTDNSVGAEADRPVGFCSSSTRRRLHFAGIVYAPVRNVNETRLWIDR